MTERVGRHAAARDLAETLIIPAQQVWPSDDAAAGPDAVPGRSVPESSVPEPSVPETSVPRAAGRHASGRTADPGRAAGAATGDAAGSAHGARAADRAGLPIAPSSRPTARNEHQSASLPAGDETPPNGYGTPPNGYGTPPNGHSSPRDYHQAPVADPAQRQRPRGSDSKLRLVWVYPDLLSTYGDRGNLLVLSRRAGLRGIEVEAIEVNADQPVPAQGDIYLLGGGEDLPQILAANRLRQDGGLVRAADRGAVVFAVCAGYQVIGDSFGGVEGEPVTGLGILDISSGRGDRRGVGELVADVDPALGVPRLTGFENHQGVTRTGSAARPLARVSLGVGNGDGTEGAYAGNVLGTYMHGPALARNPGLADLLLSWAVGQLRPLDPDTEEWASRLRAERLAAVER
jgi:lipid II isoglutaminyl synthase (glutamine-hydrolysing)